MAGAIAIVVRDPHVQGSFPACPLFWLTGLQCPGCGSTRAVHHLLHGNVVGAVRHNVLPLPAAVLALIVMTPLRSRLEAKPYLARLLLVVLLAFGVVRNLPAFRRKLDCEVSVTMLPQP